MLSILYVPATAAVVSVPPPVSSAVIAFARAWKFCCSLALVTRVPGPKVLGRVTASADEETSASKRMAKRMTHLRRVEFCARDTGLLEGSIDRRNGKASRRDVV